MQENERQRSHCLANLAIKILAIKVVIELWFVPFLSEIVLVISNRTPAARSFDFEITRMISDQIALHSVQSPLLITISRFVRTLHCSLLGLYSKDEEMFSKTWTWRQFGILALINCTLKQQEKNTSIQELQCISHSTTEYLKSLSRQNEEVYRGSGLWGVIR